MKLLETVFLFVLCVVFTRTENTPPKLTNGVQLLKNNGFNGEKHEVKTSDGYILTLHRIPSKNKKAPVVFLQHGLLVSGEVFALTNESLAYELAKNGNDVWMGNARGNVNSRRHTSLKPDEEAFWNFSWHEMGTHDLTSEIDYILKKTNQQKLYYLGHSMGTTMFFVMASEKPEYMDKIKAMVALAPIVYCNKYQFILSEGSAMNGLAKRTLKALIEKQKWETTTRKDVPKSKHQVQCDDFPEMMIPYCNMALDMAKMAVGDYVPAGTSIKTVQHYFQSYTTGKIAKFDYEDAATNKKMYNSEKPPEYNLKNVKIPVHIFYTVSDQAVSENDVKSLAKDLPNLAELYKIPNEDFNHLDFIYKTDNQVSDAYATMTTKIKGIFKR